MASIDDEVAEAGIGGKKFADDDADKAQADIDLHVADDIRNTAGDNNFFQHILTIAAKSPYQEQFIRVCLDKTGGQVNDCTENRKRYSADNDGFHVVAKPHNENGSQRSFWQAV